MNNNLSMNIPPRLGEIVSINFTVTGIKFIPKRAILRIWYKELKTGKQVIIDYPQNKLEDVTDENI